MQGNFNIGVTLSLLTFNPSVNIRYTNHNKVCKYVSMLKYNEYKLRRISITGC